MANQQQVSTEVHDKEVEEAHRHIVRILYDRVLDFKHHNPLEVMDCIEKLQRLFDNVVQHPEDAHFRKVRASNKAFERHVTNCGGAVEVMVEAGWRLKVVDFERCWVFEGEPHTLSMRVLEAAVQELGKARDVVQAKAQRYTDAMRDPHADERALREQLRMQIKGDQAERHDRFVYSC